MNLGNIIMAFTALGIIGLFLYGGFSYIQWLRKEGGL